MLVEELLKRTPEQLEATDDTNATPLVLATLGGHLSTVRMLVARGANVNHKNWQGHSALQYACSKGHFEVGWMTLMDSQFIFVHGTAHWDMDRI